MEFYFLSGYPTEFKTRSVDTTLVVERLAVERNGEVLITLPPLESFLESQIQRFTIFSILENLENPQIRCVEVNKYQQSISSTSAGEKFGELYQQNRIRDFESFVDQAAPGFELGKKDLQSPALPLGHAAKLIKNR